MCSVAHICRFRKESTTYMLVLHFYGDREIFWGTYYSFHMANDSLNLYNKQRPLPPTHTQTTKNKKIKIIAGKKNQ